MQTNEISLWYVNSVRSNNLSLKYQYQVAKISGLENLSLFQKLSVNNSIFVKIGMESIIIILILLMIVLLKLGFVFISKFVG